MTARDYTKYNFSTIQIILYTCAYFGIAAVYSSLFYDSVVPAFISLLLIKIYFKFLRDHLINKQKEELLSQFKEWLFSINSSLMSGYALENAIYESLNELETLFGKKSYIYQEVYLMTNKIKLNYSLDNILEDFAIRSGLYDVNTFSQVITLVKKNGGDMILVIKNASENIGEEISLKNQINTIVSSSKYELYIMAIFPLVIIVYIDFTQPGFFEPLYHNIFGICVMTVCLGVYFASLVLANKILKISRRF